MTPTLRKYHRTVWFFLMGFVPVLFVAAIVVMPAPQPTPPPTGYQPTALPQVLASVESLWFFAKLLGDGGGDRQLEIEPRQPLAAPALLVYLLPEGAKNKEEGILLGTLSGSEAQRFNLGKLALRNAGILLHDPIKNAPIETITL